MIVYICVCVYVCFSLTLSNQSSRKTSSFELGAPHFYLLLGSAEDVLSCPYLFQSQVLMLSLVLHHIQWYSVHHGVHRLDIKRFNINVLFVHYLPEQMHTQMCI